VDVYARAAGHARRIAESLGLERRARDVTPTLDQYLKSSEGDNADEEAAS
jgi:hypothetical protein